MKSLERRFLKIQGRRQSHGAVINFNEAVKGQRFSRDRIGRSFKRLVEKGEYSGSNIREILAYAFSLSGALNRTPKEGQTSLGGVQNGNHGDQDV